MSRPRALISGYAVTHAAGEVKALRDLLTADQHVTQCVLEESPAIARDWRGLSYVDRISRLVIGCIDSALADAGDPHTSVAPPRIGCSAGTFYGSQRINERAMDVLLAKGPRFVSANDFAIDTYNSPLGLASILHGWTGPTSTYLTMCGAGDAVAWAVEQIRAARAEVMVVVGYDEVTPFSRAYFESLRGDGNNQEKAPLCEGVGVLILEAEESVRQRGAVPRGEVIGWGSAAPSQTPRMWTNALTRALSDAALSPDAIARVLLGAGGSDQESAHERAAVEDVFGAARAFPVIISMKPHLGHACAASVVIETIVSLADLAGRTGGTHLEPFVINSGGFSSAVSSLVIQPS